MNNRSVLAGLYSLWLVPCLFSTVAAQSGTETEETDSTPTSTEQGQTPMDSSFEPRDRATVVREERRQAFRDTDFYGELRTFYFDSDNLNGSHSEAWAIGGSAGLKTGYFRDLFAFGATAYTSQPVNAPADKDGTKLLEPGQHGYTVLGESYVDIRLADGVDASIGRKGFDTPFISRFDSRMTPNTFQAAVVQGSVGGDDGAPGWRFGGGYIDQIKQRNSDEFVSMSAAAGAHAGVSRGVSVAGALYQEGSLSVGGIDYYSEDIINIGYFEAKDAFALTNRLSLKLAAQYTGQHSVGENLLMGHEYSARQIGAKIELAFAGALLTAAYTSAGKTGTNIQSPWSGKPGYTSVQVEDFDRSGETAWMARAAYNFPPLRNLTAYVLYVQGSTPSTAGQYAQREYDLNLEWKASSRKWQALKLLARYGHVSEAGPKQLRANQLRLVLYYDPAWL
jgi:outer membrane porin, OprD family